MHPIQVLLQKSVASRIGSGMAASFGKVDDLLSGKATNDFYAGAISHLPGAMPVGENTVFDLASLTKILGTTLLTMKRVEEGRMSLEQDVGSLLTDYGFLNAFASKIRLHHLLTHTSGLPAWRPFYEALRARFGENLPWVDLDQRQDYFKRALYSVAPDGPPGEKIVYSDLGFLLLGAILSSNLEEDLVRLWSCEPGLALHFRPVRTDAYSERRFLTDKATSVAMTEDCPWRGLLQGQVHDDNAWSLGGVAGHAGVFGRLVDLKGWIKGVFSNSFVSMNTLQQFTREFRDPSGVRRALGFDLPAQDGSGSTGSSFSMNSIGHLGFTGTSLWIDLDSGDYAILLTNRVHPRRDDLRIRQLRRSFHALVRSWS